MAVKFTVVVGTARGAFEHEENAKQEAMDLAYKNRPNEVWIENDEGNPIWAFRFIDNEMHMESISRHFLIVDYQIPDDA